MFQNNHTKTLTKLLSALLVFLSLSTAGALAQPERERRVAEPTATPAPSPAVTPAPARPIAPVANPLRTLAELQSRIAEIVRQPALEPGIFAVKIVSLDTGNLIFEQYANKFVRPASNMKLYTVAAALDRLTPDYHFITSVYAKEKADKGTIKGDLVGDESYFNGAPLGSGWEWEDLQWSYGAQVSALTVNDNAIDLTIKPGEKVGAAAVITSGPPATFMTIANRATTGPKGSKSELQLYRGLGGNTLEVSGSLPLGDSGFIGSVAIPDPALAFATMLRDALVKRGVKVDGRVRTVDARSAASIV